MFTGEKLTKEEAKGLMNELCDPEDAEGFTPFMRKLNIFYNFIAIWLQKEPNISNGRNNKKMKKLKII